MSTHLFIDNSNMIGGAQRTAAVSEAHAPWQSVRIYWKHLFALIEEQRGGQTKLLAGSVPPGNEELWQYARDFGYNTDLLKRVEAEDGRMVEQAVDEILHLKVANALLDYTPPQTLVLATGDGKESDYDTSFPGQAERALKRGWHVEVWSWQVQLSNAWKRLGIKYHLLKVRRLDPFYYSITFVKGGTYRLKDREVVVASRVVSPLPPLASLKRVPRDL